jgi:hypothetical protein
LHNDQNFFNLQIYVLASACKDKMLHGQCNFVGRHLPVAIISFFLIGPYLQVLLRVRWIAIFVAISMRQSYFPCYIISIASSLESIATRELRAFVPEGKPLHAADTIQGMSHADSASCDL